MSRYLLPISAAVLLLVLGGLWFYLNRPVPVVLTPPPAAIASVSPKSAPAQMVDEQQCQGCHDAQVKDWQGSHHQLAMQVAEPQTVLADFNNAAFKGEGENSRFYRQGNEFWVNTPGADGKPADFKVAYTFGIAPLQQYLIEVGDGKLQALGAAAWDIARLRTPG